MYVGLHGPGWLYVLGIPPRADLSLWPSRTRATYLGQGPNLRAGSGRAPCEPRRREHEERPAAVREKNNQGQKKYIFIYVYICVPGSFTYHTYSIVYIVRVMYELVPACTSSSSLNLSLAIRSHITTKLHELKTALDASRGEWRCKQGASTDAAKLEIRCALVGFEGKSSMHTQQYMGRNNNFMK